MRLQGCWALSHSDKTRHSEARSLGCARPRVRWGHFAANGGLWPSSVAIFSLQIPDSSLASTSSHRGSQSSSGLGRSIALLSEPSPDRQIASMLCDGRPTLFGMPREECRGRGAGQLIQMGAGPDSSWQEEMADGIPILACLIRAAKSAALECLLGLTHVRHFVSV